MMRLPSDNKDQNANGKKINMKIRKATYWTAIAYWTYSSSPDVDQAQIANIPERKQQKSRKTKTNGNLLGHSSRLLGYSKAVSRHKAVSARPENCAHSLE